MWAKSRVQACAPGRQVVHREAHALCFPAHPNKLHLEDSRFKTGQNAQYGRQAIERLYPDRKGQLSMLSSPGIL